MSNNIDGIDEQVLVKGMFAEIDKLKETHPDYYAYLDDVDADTASRAELLDLIASAPNKAIQYFLFGKFTMRITIASVTGREFK